jgi:RimJ/RimL family protein N-acetyltransferase
MAIGTTIPLQTERLLLRQWRDADLEPFARLNADPRVMAYFPAPIARADSDAAVLRWRSQIAERGWGLWAAELRSSGELLGFVGLQVPAAELPFSPCVEVGWRLAHEHWGHGYATEGARAALQFGFERLGLNEIVSFTALGNARSRAVMRRLGMLEDPYPFEHPSVPVGRPLRTHCLYRLGSPHAAGTHAPQPLQLVRPAAVHLASYRAALALGWSPDSQRGGEAARDELERLERDPHAYLERMFDRSAGGPPVMLPDGSVVERIPGYRHWLWDGEFCGVIGFRYQPGTTELPPHVLGHVGYSVVPWKRRRGYATRALALLLSGLGGEGLPWVELTTDPDNSASRRVIEANGGVLVETFTKPAAYGGTPGLRYRIALPAVPAVSA